MKASQPLSFLITELRKLYVNLKDYLSFLEWLHSYKTVGNLSRTETIKRHYEELLNKANIELAKNSIEVLDSFNEIKVLTLSCIKKLNKVESSIDMFYGQIESQGEQIEDSQETIGVIVMIEGYLVRLGNLIESHFDGQPRIKQPISFNYSLNSTEPLRYLYREITSENLQLINKKTSESDFVDVLSLSDLKKVKSKIYLKGANLDFFYLWGRIECWFDKTNHLDVISEFTPFISKTGTTISRGYFSNLKTDVTKKGIMNKKKIDKILDRLQTDLKVSVNPPLH